MMREILKEKSDAGNARVQFDDVAVVPTTSLRLFRTRTLAVLIGFAFCLTARAVEQQKIGSYTWSYEVYDNTEYTNNVRTTVKRARIVAQDGCAVFPDPTGSLTIPSSLGGYAVKSIGGSSFEGCLTVTSVTIPVGVETIGSYAFANCSALKSVTLPTGLKTLEYKAFYNCDDLVSVKIPDTVETIDSCCFSGCQSLASVHIGSSVTTVSDSMFSSCPNLSSVTLPNKVETIGGSAFSDCDNLSSLTIPASVKTIGSCAFGYCAKLALSVATGNANYTSVSGCLYNKDKTKLIRGSGALTSYSIPAGVSQIGDYAFSGCTSLESVTIPRTVLGIGVCAFDGCSGLAEINLPESVRAIDEYAFRDCRNVKRITIPASVTGIGDYAFSSCYPDKVVLYGKVWPTGVSCDATEVYVLEAYGAYWQQEKGDGVHYFRDDEVTVTVLSAEPLATDTSKLEVKYRVSGPDEKANVRALAFVDGTESFANVIRPETFAEGSQIGDGVQANEDQSFVWDVKGDWDVDLAKVTVKVYAMRPDAELVPLELISIPAIASNRAMQVSWNAVSGNDLLSALCWLYADKTEGLSVTNGVLKSGTTELVSGNTIRHGNAAAYVFGKMGYQVLTDELLPTVREITEKSLGTMNPTRSYAFKYLD